MNDRSENFLSAVTTTDRLLDDTQADWQHYGKLATDAGALKTAVAGVHTASKKLKAAEDAGGEIDAKDAAEARALDAVMVIVVGASSSVIDQPNPVLRGVRAWTRSELDKKRDTEQVTQLEAIYEQAWPHRAELVDDLVTDAHFGELHAATDALKPFVGKARGEVVTAASLRKQEAAALDVVRDVMDRLDARMEVMSHHNKPLADRYFQTRTVIDSGHRRQAVDAPAGA